MKCERCQTEAKHGGTWNTLVGYWGFKDGHDHDDNCRTRFYECGNCHHKWTESKQNTCPVCDWKGKESCWCHIGDKVTEWSDPEDYIDYDLYPYFKKKERVIE